MIGFPNYSLRGEFRHVRTQQLHLQIITKINMKNSLKLIHCILNLEEVILAEDRTTEEERNHIIEARKRAATKGKKVKGKGRSVETDDDDDDDGDGGGRKITSIVVKPDLLMNRLF